MMGSVFCFIQTPYERRGSDSSPETMEVEDCALEDLRDDVEFLTHSSGSHGSFSAKDRLGMIRLTLAELEAHNKTAIVQENTGCIYKFVHTDRITSEEKTQIAVGIVERVHTCSENGQALYDIKFCPPKGAKPASGKRHDTLYQNISADMKFNLRYKTTKGTRVENEDINLPRSVMLAFNLEINKGDGTFCKRRRNDSPYNMSSYALAENVINEFYSSSGVR